MSAKIIQFDKPKINTSDTPKKHGGARKGAGRPAGEKSVVRRVPVGVLSQVESTIAKYKGDLPNDAMFIEPRTNLKLPLHSDRVSAGFPSPAAPYVDDYIDLNEYLISNPAASILVTVKGESMIKVGIHEGDLLIVDRSLTALNRDIVLAEVDNEFTVKRLIITTSGAELHPENDDYPIIKPKSGSTISIVGVVMSVIKRFK